MCCDRHKPYSEHIAHSECTTNKKASFRKYCSTQWNICGVCSDKIDLLIACLFAVLQHKCQSCFLRSGAHLRRSSHPDSFLDTYPGYQLPLSAHTAARTHTHTHTYTQVSKGILTHAYKGACTIMAYVHTHTHTRTHTPPPHTGKYPLAPEFRLL